MKIEWNTTELMWVWRIHVRGVRTSAYIPFSPDQRPSGISDEDYKNGLRKMEEDEDGLF